MRIKLPALNDAILGQDHYKVRCIKLLWRYLGDIVLLSSFSLICQHTMVVWSVSYLAAFPSPTPEKVGYPFLQHTPWTCIRNNGTTTGDRWSGELELAKTLPPQDAPGDRLCLGIFMFLMWMESSNKPPSSISCVDLKRPIIMYPPPYFPFRVFPVFALKQPIIVLASF